ncbi:50S ribosomal protein L24 [candidate division WWE3 bacterium]|uniref:Large ribosomal subunit protein uL24 n=1 Tax=candidate division WWE3 bacterium TaxID=2053526 RepID=A0A955LJY0_UNCKA|nr:50S ribosomal protein L24 [candidate division WWE3 bacterium]
MKIKKGDKVLVKTGKDSGKQGVVELSIPSENRVVVTGVNIVKRHRKGGGNQPGGIIEKPAPIDVSNVLLVCPNCDQAARVMYNTGDKGKVRVCRKCGKSI